MSEDVYADFRDAVNMTPAELKRHAKQRPGGDVTETRWRYSLMNRGHVPLR